MKKTLFVSLALFGAALFVRPMTTQASTVTVKSGDTLWEYSQKYDVTVQAIAENNNIDLNHYMMWAGDKINIPDGKPDEQGAKFTNHIADFSQTQNQINQAFASAQPVVQPAQHSSVQQPAPKAQVQQPVQQQPVQQQSSQAASSAPSSTTGNSAKDWIANRESGGSYTAQNGRYYGKYQLDSSYLHGDFSPANQERVANQYVQSRYGSWSNAQAHWQSNGWY